MKVLNVHSSPFGIFSKTGSYMGGLEKVVFDTHNLLKSTFELKSFCSVSDNLEGDGWMPILPSEGLGYWVKNRKQLYRDITLAIKAEAPDVIINHGSEKILKLSNLLGIPSLFIDHRANQLHKLYHEGFFTNLGFKTQELGGKVYTVSEFSKNCKELEIRKLWNSDFKFDGWVNFQYVESIEPLIDIPNKKCITIGRPENNKSPHRIETLRKKFGIEYDLVTSLPDNPKTDTEKYFTTKLQSNQNIVNRMSLNVSRENTLELLKNSSLYYSTSPIESAGITAFESLSYGIPVLLHSPSGKHASTMYIPDGKGVAWEYFTTKNMDEVKFFIYKCMNYTYDERLSIQTELVNNNSKELLLNILGDIIKSIKAVSVNNLEGFM